MHQREFKSVSRQDVRFERPQTTNQGNWTYAQSVDYIMEDDSEDEKLEVAMRPQSRMNLLSVEQSLGRVQNTIGIR